MSTAIIDKPGCRQFNVVESRAGRHRTIVADYVVPMNGWVMFKIGDEVTVNWLVIMLPDREVRLIEEEPLAGEAKLEYQRWQDQLFVKVNGGVFNEA